MLKNKKAVIYDLDGTLVDSLGIWGDIDIEYLGSYGLEVPDGLQHEIEGLSFTETAANCGQEVLPEMAHNVENVVERSVSQIVGA